MRKHHYIFIAFIFIMASDPGFSQSDKTVFVKKTYYGKTLKNILDDLALSYELEMDYKVEDIRGIMIPGRSYSMSLEQVLDVVLENKNLHYKIVDEQVVIRKSNVPITLERIIYPRKTDFLLAGTVKDKKTGESLPFAQLIISGTNNGTTTNVDGYFTLFHVPADTSVVEIFYTGYEKKNLVLSPKLVSNDLLIELVPEVNVIQEILVEAEGHEMIKAAEKIGLVTLSPREISVLPNIGEQDICRSFQLLPGISASNESSSGLYVRGGTPDQNLILYDEFTVYHVDHLFGMFSAFNSNAIKDVKLYKGGFESKFGGRTSSVMEITGKDGNENNFNIGGGVSFLSANFFAESPIGENGTFLVNGRRSFQSFLYNTIFDKFSENSSSSDESSQSGFDRPFGGGPGGPMGGPPGGGPGFDMQTVQEPSSYFYDLNAKITYKLGKDIFSYSFYNGQDNLDNSKSEDLAFGHFDASGGTNDLTKWGNWGSSLKWSRKWNDKLYSNALLSYSKYYSQRDMTNERTIERDDSSFVMNMGTLEDNQLHDLSVKMVNEWKTGQNNQIEFGIQANRYINDYEYNRNDTIEIQNRHDRASLFTAYLQDKWQILDKFTFLPGLRGSYYDATGKFYLEPRISLNYQLNEKLKIKGAWGVYNQFAKRIIRDDLESGSRDFWMLADDDVIPITTANHFVAGASFETSNYLFDVEAYYKNLKGLSEYTLIFVPSFQRGFNYNEFYFKGSGFAKGIEFLAQKKYGIYTGWIAYTLGKVMYDFPDYNQEPFPANHDVRHELKLVGSYKWGNWVFSGTWIYASGKPYSAPVGGYTLNMADGSTADYITIGSKNMFRFPDYHRLDLSANLHFNIWKTTNGILGFSLFNVYNRANIWYKTYEVIEGEILETNVYLLGITPNISLTLKLK